MIESYKCNAIQLPHHVLKEGFVTPQLISVQNFAFRGRPVSLLVASLLWGLTCLASPAGVFVFTPNQLLEAINI
jgi:hypothetical protein